MWVIPKLSARLRGCGVFLRGCLKVAFTGCLSPPRSRALPSARFSASTWRPQWFAPLLRVWASPRSHAWLAQCCSPRSPFTTRATTSAPASDSANRRNGFSLPPANGTALRSKASIPARPTWPCTSQGRARRQVGLGNLARMYPSGKPRGALRQGRPAHAQQRHIVAIRDDGRRAVHATGPGAAGHVTQDGRLRCR